MEYQKMINLLDNISNTKPKIHQTKNPNLGQKLG